MTHLNKKPHLKKKATLFGKIVECLFLCLLFLLFILPFYWMLTTSLKTTSEALAMPPVWWPAKLQWGNYADAWQRVNFVKYGKNSVFISLVVVAFCMLFSIPSAYAFARMKFRFKKPLFAIVLSDMMISAQCTFLPVFMMFSKMHLLNTYRSMIILFAYSGSTIFFIRNAFMQIDNEVLEAARLDGASELSIMFKVACPMVKPAIVTMALFAFLRRWNDYFWNLVLTTSERIRTLPFAVQALSRIEDSIMDPWGTIMAGVTMLMAPMLIAYIFANKQIKNAFAYSGIK